ncbi:nucleotidyltransferase domain-containing protein [Paenibacillus sp. GCM10012307]|uniref:Amino acid transporter n=1 Tax=Paenibacillus roseus TaxID=2798579 RepID=A0A934J3C4_9BACL|nr:hypothetical protein [Paenibacillus roseus]MBJ6360723.1 hypothetical protein [Paenibacillus roseus]
MRKDYDNWNPLSVDEMVAIMDSIPVTWCFAGGWALDLYIGRQTREHGDIDIVLFHDEQATMLDGLAKNWRIYKADQGELSNWEPGEALTTVKDVWVSKDEHSPFTFQLMLVDRKDGAWIYHRERTIQRPEKDIIAMTSEGIPYLKPEIQLLYKGGSSEIREKDHRDFQNVLPLLTLEEREWLKNALDRQFPGGHVWMAVMGQ